MLSELATKKMFIKVYKKLQKEKNPGRMPRVATVLQCLRECMCGHGIIFSMFDYSTVQ